MDSWTKTTTVYKVGDVITMEVPDATLWNRFLYRMIGKKIPNKTESFKCTHSTVQSDEKLIN